MKLSKIRQTSYFLFLFSALFLLGIFSFETLKADSGTTVKLDYVAGRDASGNATGTASISVNTQATKGNYLYTGGAGNATACSQSEGEAVGCELKVFDISNPANPVYVAGRDVSGNATGTVNGSVSSVAIKGNYLFVGKSGNVTACSQVAGNAEGCELQVYDISSSTNPIYVAGRDTSGSNSDGNSSVGINTLNIKGDYLFLGKIGNNISCLQVADFSGCELKVFNISSSTNPTYVAGMDISGSSDGTGYNTVSSLVIRDNYLFVGLWSNSFIACSQSSGSATGCELQVYDISSSTNPIYVAGRDIDGSVSGTVFGYVYSLTIYGNYLFVGNGVSSTACSQIAGSAQGCELQVYDISNPANPIYVAGRDGDGSAGGSSYFQILSLATKDSRLFVGRGTNTTSCSQVVGEAVGCELQVYDISSSTNPIYIKGMDSSGIENGTSSNSINSLIFKNNHLFIGKQGNSSACSQTPGSALGCELQVYSFATFLNHSTSFTISQEINEELSLSLINPITLSTLPGLSGGTTVASTTFNIKTNSHSGYSTTLNFSTATSLQRIEGEGYLNNYLPQSSTTPDYTFNPPTTSHSFAYNLTSTSTDDLTPLFKHNGTTCNTGTNSTPTNCWYNQANATIPLTLINRPTSTTNHGIDYTLTFRVDVAPNPSPSLPEGVYQATATITVLPN